MPRRRRGGGNSASKRIASPEGRGAPSDSDGPVTPIATYTPVKQKRNTPSNKQARDDVHTARGRFRGALKDAMEYNCEDSDTSTEHSPCKRERNWSEYKICSQTKRDLNDYTSDNDDSPQKSDRKRTKKKFRKNQKPFSYVMKLFDRSVDLAQYTEKTPLYIICRGWMQNDPKKHLRSPPRKTDDDDSMDEEDGFKLPGPEGPPVSRVPPLIPEQCTRSKNNINLDYDENPPVSRDVLLKNHLKRWNSIRKKWLEQSAIYESRYAKTQEILNEMESSSY